MSEIKVERSRRVDFATGFLTALLAKDDYLQKIMDDLEQELGETLTDLLERGIVEISDPRIGQWK